MKLFYSKTSPYSRKVRLVIVEKALQKDIELVLCNPFADTSELENYNPLACIPTLVTDEGASLFDSPVICEYLDSIGAGPSLLPESGAGRWQVKKWEAFADGVTDSAYNIVMERRRCTGEQSQTEIDKWQKSIVNALDYANAQIHTMPGDISLGHLALGASLGYLDFRLSDINWRINRPELVALYETISQRQSMETTIPVDN